MKLPLFRECRGRAKQALAALGRTASLGRRHPSAGILPNVPVAIRRCCIACANLPDYSGAVSPRLAMQRGYVNLSTPVMGRGSRQGTALPYLRHAVPRGHRQRAHADGRAMFRRSRNWPIWRFPSQTCHDLPAARAGAVDAMGRSHDLVVLPALPIVLLPHPFKSGVVTWETRAARDAQSRAARVLTRRVLQLVSLQRQPHQIPAGTRAAD